MIIILGHSAFAGYCTLFVLLLIPLMIQGRVISIEDFNATAEYYTEEEDIGETANGFKDNFRKEFRKNLKAIDEATLLDANGLQNTMCGHYRPKFPEHHEEKLAVAEANRRAFNFALETASSGDIVLVPEGKTFVMLGGVVANQKENITIDIAGSLSYLYDTKRWTKNETPKSPLKRGRTFDPAFALYLCKNVTVTSSSSNRAQLKYTPKNHDISLQKGDGMIVGNGEAWWYDDLFNCSCLYFDGHKYQRPRLLYVMQSSNVVVEYITLVNSPYWSFTFEAEDSIARFVNVIIDTKFQQDGIYGSHYDLRQHHEKTLVKVNKETGANIQNIFGDGYRRLPIWLRWIPIFGIINDILEQLGSPEALNTDGIDPQGQRILIHNCTIKCADDTVAAKPISSGIEGNVLGDCTEDIWVENMTLQGVGASIGGVHPQTGTSCVNNVTFNNIFMPGTARGVYIKPDGATCQPVNNTKVSGSISNISYKNMKIVKPKWWPIWIGPQQQGQPGGDNTLKCSLAWPFFNAACVPPSCVDVRNVSLVNITIENPRWPWVGAIQGPEGNPFLNVTFDNVRTTGNIWNKIVPKILKWLGLSGRKAHIVFDAFKKEEWSPYAACRHANGTYTETKPGPACLEKVKKQKTKKSETDEL